VTDRPTLHTLLWPAALLATVGAGTLILRSDHVDRPTLVAVVGTVVGWSFIGTGLVEWTRRPHHRLGPMMTAIGFAWFAGALTASDDPSVFTTGVIVSNLFALIFIHMLLAFPSGFLETAWERRLVAATYVFGIVAPVPVLMFGDMRDVGCEADCPGSAIRVADEPGLASVLGAGANLIAVAILVAIAVILFRRWQSATGPARRVLTPVLWAGGATLVVLALAVLATTVSGPVSEAVGAVGTGVLALVPLAFLAALLRARLDRSAAVGDLVIRLGAERPRATLRDELARALDDPSLELAFWLHEPATYVDAHGRPVDLPDEWDPARAVTVVEREGVRVAAMIHDRSLCDDPALVHAVGAAAALTLENERLGAELHARLEELHASRARIVQAADAERRRLERNLHDGAQQRLVSLSLGLRLARARIRSDPDEAGRLLDAAADELTEALGELRELARGIHPAILTDRGLPAALEALASRAPVPVEVAETPAERLPPPVEAAAYYVILEAVTNAVKHADASAVRVSVDRRNGLARVDVLDDGVGGVDVGRGSGLRGLADRVEALDGRLHVTSPRGHGTTVVAELPCRS
jgi:signal transduction histidine kinase